MPKYQIIVWSEEDLFSQEFEDQLKESDAMLYDGSGFILKGFKLLYAQSVQGIRKELWEKREELETIIDKTGSNYAVEDTFNTVGKIEFGPVEELELRRLRQQQSFQDQLTGSRLNQAALLNAAAQQGQPLLTAQQQKCLRGEHEAAPFLSPPTACRCELQPQVCAHCRCLYVERP